MTAYNNHIETEHHLKESIMINKTTIKMAMARGIGLVVETDICDDNAVLCFWDATNDCEWMFSYNLIGDMLQWRGNVYLPQSIKEELPATIETEAKLREVVQFISDNMKEIKEH